VKKAAVKRTALKLSKEVFCYVFTGNFEQKTGKMGNFNTKFVHKKVLNKNTKSFAEKWSKAPKNKLITTLISSLGRIMVCLRPFLTSPLGANCHPRGEVVPRV
jgi:hypothetical protein